MALLGMKAWILGVTQVWIVMAKERWSTAAGVFVWGCYIFDYLHSICCDGHITFKKMFTRDVSRIECLVQVLQNLLYTSPSQNKHVDLVLWLPEDPYYLCKLDKFDQFVDGHTYINKAHL
jgi:hypothetical protein